MNLSSKSAAGRRQGEWVKQIQLDPADEYIRTEYRLHRKVNGAYVKVVAVSRGRRGKAITLARLIMNPAVDEFVDHINGDTFDNRRVNLRIVTAAQNTMNARKAEWGSASKYKGVTREHNRWLASIRVDGRAVRIGKFDNEIECATAYDTAARIHHGEYATLNFPQAGERSALRVAAESPADKAHRSPESAGDTITEFQIATRFH